MAFVVKRIPVVRRNPSALVARRNGIVARRNQPSGMAPGSTTTGFEQQQVLESTAQAQLASLPGKTGDLLRKLADDKLLENAKYANALWGAVNSYYNYTQCKKKRKSKGKEAWPKDKRMGVFVANCRNEWTRYKKHLVDLTKDAVGAKGKFERKGELDEESAELLNLAIAAPAAASTAEFEQEMADYQNKINELEAKNRRLQGTSQELAQQIQALGAPPVPEDYVGGEEGDNTMLYLGLGGAALVTLGAGVWWVRKKKAAKKL